MVIAVAGGALQGLEVTYLARKAGFETLLMDRRTDAPARGICHRFVALELTDHDSLSRALRTVDLVIPATENPTALRSLVDWCEENGTPLAFDPGAHTISSSKVKSEALFRELDLPTPAPWPACDFPVVAKPDIGSGSKGIQVFSDLQALEEGLGLPLPPGWVLQEYLPGPSCSLEVMGCPGEYSTLQITDLEMDPGHDCKRVTAPSTLPSHLVREFETMALDLAGALALSGIMDLEAVIHEGKLKLLEIDARFPSQTPAAVFHSTGINMVQQLVSLFSRTHGGKEGPKRRATVGGSLLEHVRFSRGRLSVGGEGMMAGAGPLHLARGFFGADEALTNYGPQADDWVATLMIRANDLSAARKRRNQVVSGIRDRLGAMDYRDETPDGGSEPRAVP